MEEIVERLHEQRQIELAKSILESNGYNVSKLEESEEMIWNDPVSLDEFNEKIDKMIGDLK